MNSTPEQISWSNEAGVITIAPMRGRILQANVGGHNAFWTGPKTSHSWDSWNLGGDRLWLAPEVDWYWQASEQSEFGQYGVPAAIDPGAWELVRADVGYCEIAQRVSLRHRRHADRFDVEMRRSISPARLSSAHFFASYLAYRVDNSLSINEARSGQAFGLWSLIQVPPGGTMHLPCQGECSFRDYLEPIPADLWQISGREIRLRVTAERQYKIGIGPTKTTGRATYVRPVGDQYLVVYRAFFAQPWRDYCDVPAQPQESYGDAVQVFDDGGIAGGYGELEYHSPCLVAGRESNHLCDSSLCVVGLVERADLQQWLDYWLHGRVDQ
jgi:hypothetical protein